MGGVLGEPRLSTFLRIEADEERVAIPRRRRSGMRPLRFGRAAAGPEAREPAPGQAKAPERGRCGR